MNLLVILNIIIVISAVLTCFYATKLITCLNAWFKTGWWTLLPIAFYYALANRILVLVISLGGLESSSWSEIIAASTIVFWLLILTFMYGLNREAEKILCTKKV
jgi:hypothetical protein